MKKRPDEGPQEPTEAVSVLQEIPDSYWDLSEQEQRAWLRRAFAPLFESVDSAGIADAETRTGRGEIHDEEL